MTVLASMLPLAPGVTVTDAQAAAAQGLVEAFCKWPLEQSARTASLTSDGGGMLALPCLAVGSIQSVTLRGTDPGGNPWPTLVEDKDWTWTENGLLYVLSDGVIFDGWPVGARRVQVAFTGGYSPLPPGVLSVMASVASRMARDPSMQQHLENVGGIQTNTSYTAATAAGAGLTPIEMMALSTWAMVTVA